MNKKLLFLLPIVGAMALTGCDKKKEEAHEHVDANHDHLCDSCGEKISNHTDADGDFKCDYCGADLAFSNVTLDASNAVKSFGTNEPFSSYGVKVIGTSEAGSTTELQFTTSKPDMSVPGEKTVTVTAVAGEQTHEFTYTINVSSWSNADLAKLEAAADAELTFLADSGLPFLPDHNMRVETVVENEEVKGFYITADDIDNESYLRFINDLQNYEYTDEDDCTYTFVSADTVGTTGVPLEDIVVFRLSPSEEGTHGPQRVYANDEYLLMGFDDELGFVMESFMVNAMIDGFYLGTDVNTVGDDSLWGYSKNGDQLIAELAKLPYYYFSEYSSEKFVVPELTATSSFYPISYFSSYPFSTMNDEYDLAFHIISKNNTQEIHNKFVADLLAAGYVAQEPEEQGQTYTGYKFTSEKAGSIEYNVWPFDSSDKSIDFDIFYKAPEVYTSHLRDMVEEVGTTSGITLDSAKPYGSGNSSSVGLYAYVQGTHKLDSYASENKPLEVLNSVARAFLDADQGYIVSKEAKLKEAKSGNYYSIHLSTGTIELSIRVDVAENQDGSYDVEIDIFDDEYDISPADSLAAELCKVFSADDHYGLKGVDYVENEASNSFDIAKDVTGEDLSDAAEAYGALFESLGFELASSSGKEEKSEETDVLEWSAVYDNKLQDLRITVSAVPGEEGHISVVIAVRVYRFTNPETIVKQYLESASLPADSYTIDPVSLTCVVQGTTTGAVTSAEELQAIPDGIAAHLPEGFTADGSRPYGTGTYRFAYRNTTLGIEAIIVVELTETGSNTELTLQFMPEYRVDELLMKAALKAIIGYEALEGLEYEYESNYDDYSALNLYKFASATSAENASAVASTVAYYAGQVYGKTLTQYGSPAPVDYSSMYGEGATGVTVRFTDNTDSSAAWTMLVVTAFFIPAQGCCYCTFYTYIW